MDCLAAEMVLSTCFSDTVFVNLFRTAALVETAVSGVHTSWLRTSGAPHLLNTVVLAVAACRSFRDGALGRATHRYPIPRPPFPVPNN